MKKFLTVALVAIMLLSLAACGQNEEPVDTAAPTVAATAEVDNDADADADTDGAVTDGDTEATGDEADATETPAD